MQIDSEMFIVSDYLDMTVTVYGDVVDDSGGYTVANLYAEDANGWPLTLSEKQRSEAIDILITEYKARQ